MTIILGTILKILNFIIYSNLFIAACVAVFTLQTAYIFRETSQNIFLFVIPNFISTFVLYNIQRLYFSTKYPENKKYGWYAKNKRLLFTLIILLIISAFDVLLKFFLTNITTLIIYFILSLLSLSYFLPPLRLRRFGFFKPFIISLTLVWIAVVLPLLNNLNYSILIYIISQFLFIAALCIMFDIRDRETDKEMNITTIPVKTGVLNSKIFILILVTLYFMSGFFWPIKNSVIITSIISFALILLTLFSKPSRHNYFYLFLVDGTIILQFITLRFFS